VLGSVGDQGHYRSSSPSGSYSYFLDIRSGSVTPARSDLRPYGLSVRCVKEFIPFFITRNKPANESGQMPENRLNTDKALEQKIKTGNADERMVSRTRKNKICRDCRANHSEISEIQMEPTSIYIQHMENRWGSCIPKGKIILERLSG
jgi:predicted metal-dependent hydrolase